MPTECAEDTTEPGNVISFDFLSHRHRADEIVPCRPRMKRALGAMDRGVTLFAIGVACGHPLAWAILVAVLALVWKISCRLG